MAGRCRRGNQCHFLHDDIQSHEDGWDNRQKKAGASKYFTPNDGKDFQVKSGRSSDCCTDYLKGHCRRGASCRFAHDGAADDVGRGSVNEVSRVRENSKRNRVISPERDGERDARRSSDVPCKYFAAGYCRNGKYCRFSHHSQARASPERRSRGDRGGWGQSSVSMDKFRDSAKLRDTDASYNVEKSRNGPKNDADASNEAEKLWAAGPKWSDKDASNDLGKSWPVSKWDDTAYSDGAMSKDTNGKMGTSEPRFSDWSIGQHNYDASGKNSDRDEARKLENPGITTAASEPRWGEDTLSESDTEMSPWNPTSMKTEPAHVSHGFKSQTLIDTPVQGHEKDITKEALGWVREGVAASQPMSTENSIFQPDHRMRGSSGAALPCDSNVPGRSSAISHIDLNFSSNIPPMQSFDQPGPRSSSLPYPNLNPVGQSQVAIPSGSNEVNMKGMQNNEKPSIKLNLGDTTILHGNSGIQSTQNMVSNEQLTQLTNLSASLAQLLGKGQQLPLLHAALNPHDATQVASLANSGGPTEPVSVTTVQPGEDIKLPKQYDPLADSIESVKNQETNAKPLEFSVDPVAQRITGDGIPELSANKLLPSTLVGSTNGGEYHNDHSSKREPALDSHMPNQMEPVANSEVKKENGGVEETRTAQEENKNGPSENIDADDKTEEGKKSKDGKGIRAFKFALVEFVKDLLKPTWKEGQIGKEAYKNIVKKVVDKVTASMQGATIPQTPEKIDQYLQFSKPKLTKLVQVIAAYLLI
ncbi:Zinc finger, CCCH-type [Corchorus olitorius]|uniref:Zinc finger, CCCH-type n=1 Tax=Corchorus olitorius TaxID=93759 RepID=A0A1R3JTY2_9ROSI|nr:Zinc finger, CCCH-type [Corchorus olitorius]